MVRDLLHDEWGDLPHDEWQGISHMNGISHMMNRGEDLPHDELGERISHMMNGGRGLKAMFI